MPELNFDKVLASLKLRLDEVLDESEFDEILKEYAGKESLLSAERKSLSNLSNEDKKTYGETCLLYTSPSPRDATLSRMPSSA